MITALHERRGIYGGGSGLSLYCTDNHRTDEQLREMRRLEAAGICLFCPATLREHARQQVLLALRITGATLREVQQKVQTPQQK